MDQEKRLQDPSQPKQGGVRFYVDSDDGYLVSVPKDKLASWREAQAKGTLSPGLVKYKQQIKDTILKEIYGEKTSRFSFDCNIGWIKSQQSSPFGIA